MAFLVVRRSEPFVRGDQSIGIYVDDKAIGTLPKDGPLIVEIPAGPQRVQAFMNGGHGKAITVLPAIEETICIDLSGARPQPTKWWEGLITFAVYVIPWIVLPAFDAWPSIGYIALVAAFEVSRWRIRSSRFLKLEIVQEPAEVPESLSAGKILT